MVVVAVAGWQRGECVVNLSRGSRADIVLIILIVKLCGSVGPQPWFFTPQVEEGFSTLNPMSLVHVVCVIPLLTCWLKLSSKFITSKGGYVVCIFAVSVNLCSALLLSSPNKVAL